MILPPILSTLSPDDNTHLVLACGYFYCRIVSAETGKKTTVRQRYDADRKEWQDFDPVRVLHVDRRPVVRQMFRKGLQLPEIAKVFAVDLSYVKNDVSLLA